MARTEAETKKQKRKAKKRKCDSPSPDSDEGVANKSLIVEATEEQTTRKAGKRKQQTDISEVKEKRSKQRSDNNDATEADLDGEQEDEAPTAEQLQEAAKPENQNAIVTVRQKKKQKHLQRLEAQKDQNADKEVKRNEEYLRKWRDNRQDWKFEKLRQISIQQTAFDELKVSADLWPIALEYLSSSKGAAKTILTKLAENAIQELDKQCEQLDDEEARRSIVESTRYQRARNLLQSFD